MFGVGPLTQSHIEEQAIKEYSAYVGLDVHKETIAVAVALPGRGDPVYLGEIAHRRGSLRRPMGRLSPHGEVLSFCYEAGPCRCRSNTPHFC